MVTVDKLLKLLSLIVIVSITGTILYQYEFLSYAKTYSFQSVEHFKNVTIEFHKSVLSEENHSKKSDQDNYLKKENNQNVKIVKNLKKASLIKNTTFGFRKNRNLILERNYSKNTDHRENFQ